VVRVLQRTRRRHELWVYNIPTMPGHRERDRRLLRTEYTVPASTRATSIDWDDPPLLVAVSSLAGSAPRLLLEVDRSELLPGKAGF
jgi:hypothetical protein